MAVLQVYCDESGKLADSSCVTFGSVIFLQEDILCFCDRWNEYLKVAGIKYVTMKHAMYFDGEFKAWRDRSSDRDGLLESLASLAWDSSFAITRSPMVSSEFRALSEAQRRKLKDLPYAAFEALVKGIAQLASKTGHPRDRFHLICDLSEEYSVHCLKLFNRLRAMTGNHKDLFASLSFADDTEFPPLQAADMLAYCERQKIILGDNRQPIVKRISEIFCQGKSFGEKDLLYKNESGLGHGTLELPIQ